MPPFVLALDIGSSSARALIFDHRGVPVPESESQRPVELITTASGGAEFDPRALLDASFQCIDAAAARAPGSIAAVGISCFWHSLLGLDANGDPTTPVLMYSDTRSANEVERLKRLLDDDDVHNRTGCRIHSSYWPSKISWLKSEFPGAFDRTARWAAFSDYLLERTHRFRGTSLSMAAATGMMDVRKATWDEGMIAASGVAPETLPEIAPLHAVEGPMAETFSLRWPALAGARWFPGVGDGACANIGTGAVTAGRIALTVGTTAAVRVMIQPSDMGGLEIPADLFAYRIDETSVLLGGAISNAGQLIAWLLEMTGASFEGPELNAAGNLAPDAHGLTLLPFLTGERSPLWSDRVSGVIAGLTLHTDRAEILRAGLESVAFRLARLYRSVGRAAADPHHIVANGGAILRSSAWLGITADSLGHPIEALPETAEASARGAAIMALRGIGAIRDLSDVNDPVDGARTITPIVANTLIYRAAIARQAKLEAILYPKGAVWSDD